MRLHAFRTSTVLGLIVCAVAAAIFGLAGSTSAGGAATCTTPSTPPTGPEPGSPSSCVIERLAPAVLTINTADVPRTGLSLTRFNDQGSNTATHLDISTTFSSAVAVQSITLILNGSPVSSSSCTPAGPFPTSPTTTVSCTDVGSVKGGKFAELIVRYVAPSSPTTLTAFGKVTYAEGGLKGNPTNGTQWSNVDSVDVVTNAANASGKPLQAGKCTTIASKQSDSIAAGDTTLAASAVYPAAKNQSTLTCTPAATGVIQSSPNPLVTEIAFVEVPELAGTGSAQGFAVVNVDFTPLPAGVTLNGQNKLVLLEDTQYVAPFFGTYITVPEGCNATTGLPPNPGIPEPGSTDSSDPPHLNDTCIFDRKSLPGGGGRLILHVIGNPLDGKYGA
jgi:hypothetical protein